MRRQHEIRGEGSAHQRELGNDPVVGDRRQLRIVDAEHVGVDRTTDALFRHADEEQRRARALETPSSRSARYRRCRRRRRRSVTARPCGPTSIDCRGSHSPNTYGVPKRRAAYDRPSIAATSAPRCSGTVGSPKFKQSVRPSGRAPTATTLRTASSTACSGCELRVALPIARIAGDRERDGKWRAGNRTDDAGIGRTERNRGGAAHDAVVALEDRAARAHVAMREQRFERDAGIGEAWFGRACRPADSAARWCRGDCNARRPLRKERSTSITTSPRCFAT